MEKTLEDYIAQKSTLQAAIVRAKFRSNFSQRFHNFDEFRAESREYICKDMEEDSDPGTNKANNNVPVLKTGDGNMGSKSDLNLMEEAYLALDVNEEEEFDKWYEQVNSNLIQKQHIVSTKANADSSVNNMNDNGDVNVEREVLEPFSNNMTNNVKSPGFDLRQLIDKNKEIGLQNGFQNLQISKRDANAPDGDQPILFRENKRKNNNKNKRRQNVKCWSDVKNNFMGNNAPYRKRVINGRFANGHINNVNSCVGLNNASCLWHNQNVCSHQTGNGIFGAGLNSRCCPFHAVPMPTNTIQNSYCNGNSICDLNLYGYYGINSLNTPFGFDPTNFTGGTYDNNLCICNHGARTFGSGTNILNELLNLVAVYADNSSTSNCQLGNQMRTDIKSGDQEIHTHNSTNNSKNLYATIGSAHKGQQPIYSHINMDNHPKENNGASMTHVNPNELNSATALVSLINLFERGINIQLSQDNINQLLNLNPEIGKK